MGLSSFDEYIEHYSEYNGIAINLLTATTGVVTRANSAYLKALPLKTAPTTIPSILYASSFGAQTTFPLPFSLDNPPDAYYILAARINPAAKTGGAYYLCDRLIHTGGYSASGAKTITTNLPTPALPRHTDGKGVFAALEIYTQIGTTATSATISYTNTNDVSGRTSPAVVFGGTGFRELGRFIKLPLQSGDLGIKSVESITIGNTATAGSFGLTLYKPLYFMAINNADGPHYLDFVNGGLIGEYTGLDPQTYLFMVSVGTSLNLAAQTFLFICDGNT